MLFINSGFLILDTTVTSQNKKKMSGHSFVTLAGINQCSKRGDAILQLLGYYKPSFEKKYQYRGDMAEKMVKFILDKQNKEYKTYNEDYKKKHNYDCFPEYKYCGGIPDFELYKESTIIEVKSKSMAKYDDIKKEMPIEEVEQGCYYAFLRKYDYVKMAYVFFDEETEKSLFENKIPKTLDNCKIILKQIKVDHEKLKQEISNALIFYNACLDNKAIPIDDISPEVLKALREKGLLDTDGL